MLTTVVFFFWAVLAVAAAINGTLAKNVFWLVVVGLGALLLAAMSACATIPYKTCPPKRCGSGRTTFIPVSR